MNLALRYAMRTDRGLVREGNEDSGYAGPRVLAVADGMGGHVAGEVASSEVISEVASLDKTSYASKPADALTNAMEVANGRLRERVAEDSSLEGMGTTLAALLLSGEQFAMLHVGDSRIYLLEGDTLRQLTKDDTFVQQLVDEGRITEEEALTHPQRSLLTQALDGREVEPHVRMVPLLVGQRFLLCTDGLSGFVPEDVIVAALRLPEPGEAADTLIDAALQRGAPDNVTVIVADVVQSSDESDTGELPGATTAIAGTAAGAARVAGETGGSPPTEDLDTPEELRAEPEVANLADGPGAAVAGSGGPSDEDDESPPRRIPKWLGFLIAILVILIGSLIVVLLWLRGQWYVGTSDGQVAIYQGIPESIGSVELSRVDSTTDIAVADLQGPARSRVEDTIPVDSKEQAQAEVDKLSDQLLPVCPTDVEDAPPGLPGVDCREVPA